MKLNIKTLQQTSFDLEVEVTDTVPLILFPFNRLDFDRQGKDKGQTV